MSYMMRNYERKRIKVKSISGSQRSYHAVVSISLKVSSSCSMPRSTGSHSYIILPITADTHCKLIPLYSNHIESLKSNQPITRLLFQTERRQSLICIK